MGLPANTSEREFIELFTTIGPTEMAKQGFGNLRTILTRRRYLEQKHRRKIASPNKTNRPVTHAYVEHPHRATLTIGDGVVLVGSDLHAWPGEPSTAFRAFVKFAKKHAPVAVIMNGDVIDGASISRHPPIGWEKQPTLLEELEVAQERLQAILLAVPKKTRLLWPLGNHDARLSTRLATVAPEFAGIHGTRLQDHFTERWEPCWSAWINDDVVVKHRHKNGIHAAHNSTMWAGKTMVTGHLHSLKVTPFTDYASTRFGIDCGCLADVGGRQFLYLEDNPVNWRSGFVVLTFRDGRLMWPEIVHVIGNDKVEFRGEIISV